MSLSLEGEAFKRYGDPELLGKSVKVVYDDNKGTGIKFGRVVHFNRFFLYLHQKIQPHYIMIPIARIIRVEILEG